MASSTIHTNFWAYFLQHDDFQDHGLVPMTQSIVIQLDLDE